MVKNAKLWREISLQYAKLAELECESNEPAEGSPEAREPTFDAKRHAHGSGPAPLEQSEFYKHGFCHKHYVLILCTLMVMCEWMDRSVLSIAMQAIKEEFSLLDAQVGLMASASLWMVPVAISFLGRLADYVPKSTMLGIGVLGWGACTLATGSAKSFAMLIVSRLLAGLSNCAGYPVAVSLLAEFFSPKELTTAMGYFNAGFGIGGLLGMALGGTLITQLGWRWAFWGVASPQLVLSVLLIATVREKHQPPPRQSWARDLGQLLRMPAIRFLMASALISGLMTGNSRFITALAERLFQVSAQTVGLVMGLSLGLTGIVAGPVAGHLVDLSCRRLRDHRALLWCAAGADVTHLVLGTCALLSPSFGLFVLLLALAACAASMGQGVDTAIQMLAVGRRGTTQGLMELSWAIGMAAGPFLGGLLSDSLLRGSCDSGCALARSLMVVAGVGLCLRALCCLMAAASFKGDVDKVRAAGAVDGEPDPGLEPQPTTVGRAAPAREEPA